MAEQQKSLTCSPDGSPCGCSPYAGPFQDHSIKVDLSDGEKKYICVCAASKNFPFCDGSHRALNAEKGTKFRPVIAVKEVNGDRISVCACGHSKKRDLVNEDGSYQLPLCDGAHRKLIPVKDE